MEKNIDIDEKILNTLKENTPKKVFLSKRKKKELINKLSNKYDFIYKKEKINNNYFFKFILWTVLTFSLSFFIWMNYSIFFNDYDNFSKTDDNIIIKDNNLEIFNDNNDNIIKSDNYDSNFWSPASTFSVWKDNTSSRLEWERNLEIDNNIYIISLIIILVIIIIAIILFLIKKKK